VALANLDLFERERIVSRVERGSRHLGALLQPFAELRHVGEVRQSGYLVGIELVRDRAAKEPFDWRAATGARVCRRARELRLITRPLGDVVTFVPPLVAGEGELAAMTGILYRALQEVTEG